MSLLFALILKLRPRIQFLHFTSYFLIGILLPQFIFVSGTQKLLVCYSYKNLMTFGGCKQDFMLVMGQNVGTNASKDKPTEKHLFAMDPSKIREVTLLISSYINSAHQQKAAAHHLSAPALMVAQPVRLKSKELRSKSPPALGRPSKAPTLL